MRRAFSLFLSLSLSLVYDPTPRLIDRRNEHILIGSMRTRRAQRRSSGRFERL